VRHGRAVHDAQDRKSGNRGAPDDGDGETAKRTSETTPEMQQTVEIYEKKGGRFGCGTQDSQSLPHTPRGERRTALINHPKRPAQSRPREKKRRGKGTLLAVGVNALEGRVSQNRKTAVR